MLPIISHSIKIKIRINSFLDKFIIEIYCSSSKLWVSKKIWNFGGIYVKVIIYYL